MTFTQLLKDTLASVSENTGTFAKTGGVWFGLQTVLLTALLTVQGPKDLYSVNLYANLDGAVFLFGVGFAVVSTASMAQAWHRWLLLADRPAPKRVPDGPAVLKYAWKLVLVSGAIIAVLGVTEIAVLMLIIVTGYEVLTIENDLTRYAALTLITLLGAGLLAGVFLVVGSRLLRFTMVLPAEATNRPLGFREAYDLAAGMGVKMVLVCLVLAVPLTIAAMLLDVIFQHTKPAVPALAAEVQIVLSTLLIQLPATYLAASLITCVYRQAVERNPTINGQKASAH